MRLIVRFENAVRLISREKTHCVRILSQIAPMIRIRLRDYPARLALAFLNCWPINRPARAHGWPTVIWQAA